MQLKETPIKDLWIVQLDIFSDERGFFAERFNEQKFKELSISTHFVQDNHSRSYPKVLRGLHMQIDPPQAKLVGCTRGAIFDVAVDLRPQSPTYMQHFSITLSAENGKLLWIPEGFAHGFCVIGKLAADVIYKVNNRYCPEGEIGIIWNEPEFNISWPYNDPILSKRDQNLPSYNKVVVTSALV